MNDDPVKLVRAALGALDTMAAERARLIEERDEARAERDAALLRLAATDGGRARSRDAACRANGRRRTETRNAVLRILRQIGRSDECTDPIGAVAARVFVPWGGDQKAITRRHAAEIVSQHLDEVAGALVGSCSDDEVTRLIRERTGAPLSMIRAALRRLRTLCGESGAAA